MATSSLENPPSPWELHHANHSGAIELGLQSLFSLAHPREYDDGSAPFFADLLSGLRRLRDSFLPASPEHAPAQQHVDALAAALLARWRRATTPSIPPTTVATLRTTRELCAARHLGAEHPALLRELRGRWRALPTSSLFGYDPAVSPPNDLQFGATNNGVVSRWHVYQHALALSRCAATLELPLPPEASLPALLGQLAALRPYCGPSRCGRAHYQPQLHALVEAVRAVHDDAIGLHARRRRRAGARRQVARARGRQQHTAAAAADERVAARRGGGR